MEDKIKALDAMKDLCTKCVEMERIQLDTTEEKLKAAMIEIRNTYESSYEELYSLSVQKKIVLPPMKADKDMISEVKSLIQSEK
ncbi:hypothetical protein lbkm_0631 [Lachnospiraceae bacterium KM106-2]|nr:hypothetical protein lbkm_0631 [Lachnospiraceae bacterium KM106-2]